MCQPELVRLSDDRMAKTEAKLHHASKKRQHQISGHGWFLFRLGRLRFGAHGLMGCTSLVLTLWTMKVLDATAESSHGSLNPSTVALVLANQALLAGLASHATTLLPQVPPFTTIVPGLIVAPHKEAFQRTISIMLYLNCRILLQVAEHTATNMQLLQQQTKVSWALCSACILLWRYWPLVPSLKQTSKNASASIASKPLHQHPSSQWTNGNTWIFVVPMFLATSLDLFQLFFWKGDDFMSTRDLVDVQLTGLLLAFGFSLGFRNYLPMPAGK